MTDVETAWIAGLLEGEGCFNVHTLKKKKDYFYPRVMLGMTDKDVVDRFHDLVGYGNRTVVVPKQEHWKTEYRWYSSATKNNVELMHKVYPFMGERRKLQIAFVLTKCEQPMVTVV